MIKKLCLAIAFAACSRTAAEAPKPLTAEPRAPKAVVGKDASIYDLEIPLVDSRGRTIALDELRGKPVLFTMFYSSCAVACPALIDHIDGTLADANRDDVHVLLVSFDPARDTPARLAQLARDRSLDARWLLATPSDTGARELAAAVGIKFRKLDNGEFYHGSTIVLFDGEGRTAARAEGFQQRDVLLTALR